MIPRVPYGKTGYEVSRLGLGAMRLPIRDDHGSCVFEESTRIIRRALELGVNFFDSHHSYLGGQSETALGTALAGVERSRYIIQTKSPFYRAETPEDTYLGRLERGLDKLGSGYIDLYLLHSVSMDKFEQHGEGFLAFAEKAKREGLVRHIGFSSHDKPESIHKLIDMGAFACMLVQFNFLETQNAEVLAHAREQGLGTSVMGPLGGGRFVRPTVFTEGAGEDGAAELALRFVWSNPNIDTALSGATRLSDVEENARIIENFTPLTDEELGEIAAEIRRRESLADVYCTACGYCMPCPNGVAIANVFTLRNWHEVYGIKDAACQRYAGLCRKDRGAPACVECGECREKCPQKIEIIEQLKESHEILTR